MATTSFERQRDMFAGLAASWLVLAGAMLLALGIVGSPARAEGLGDQELWRSGALLDNEFDQMEARQRDSIFEQYDEFDSPELDQDEVELLYSRYVDLIKRWPIELVAPGRELTKLMNVVSTKSRAHFLQEHEQYFKHLKLGTTSRPMLMAYLGLRLSDREELRGWLSGAMRRIGPIKGSTCRPLLELRDTKRPTGERAGEDQQLLGQLRLLKEREQRHKFRLAHLTFSNNLNLFMLENFLILCSKLELAAGPEADEFRAQYEALF